MQATPRIFPIGIQDFEQLRTLNNVYVDKTDLVYQLVKSNHTCFLSRPRRFGKSLLLSTLRAYFEGKKHLFEGLAMEQLETEWTAHPVLHISFAGSKYIEVKNLQALLNDTLAGWEAIYGSSPTEETFNLRFKGVIRRACEQTGQQVVVLIDEYDSPILSAMGASMEERRTELRGIMRDFFSPLKDSGVYIRFLFLTGITKFSQLSIFSELNHLENISMLPDYSSICGITETELLTQFKPDIAALAARNGETYEEACAHLKQLYDGYHFCENTEEIYNPYSIINVLKNRKYDSYWYSTATPTFLIELLKHSNLIPEELEGCKAVADDFNTAIDTLTDPIPVLYQSGYLTIKNYRNGIYTLGYPNDEVRIGFVRSLIPSVIGSDVQKSSMSIIAMAEALDTGDVETCMKRMRAFIASIPYERKSDNESRAELIFYMLFTLMGQFTQTQVPTAIGRADVVIKNRQYIYIFEIKVHGTADDALEQIERQHYAVPYETDPRQVVRIGVTYDAQTRGITDWKVER
ncbi:MAG: ATP-binding protein [Prevotellaceae bacterium]|jgi:hypothetical protein|nr:ATP-binding protein [Prevotellaceae bacterium]